MVAGGDNLHIHEQLISQFRHPNFVRPEGYEVYTHDPAVFCDWIDILLEMRQTIFLDGLREEYGRRHPAFNLSAPLTFINFIDFTNNFIRRPGIFGRDPVTESLFYYFVAR